MKKKEKKFDWSTSMYYAGILTLVFTYPYFGFQIKDLGLSLTFFLIAKSIESYNKNIK